MDVTPYFSLDKNPSTPYNTPIMTTPTPTTRDQEVPAAPPTPNIPPIESSRTRRDTDKHTREYLILTIRRHFYPHFGDDVYKRSQRPWAQRLRTQLGIPSAEALIARLEAQFDPLMCWENWGLYWHISHITPCRFFPYTTHRDPSFKKAWNLSNLYPSINDPLIQKQRSALLWDNRSPYQLKRIYDSYDPDNPHVKKPPQTPKSKAPPRKRTRRKTSRKTPHQPVPVPPRDLADIILAQ